MHPAKHRWSGGATSPHTAAKTAVTGMAPAGGGRGGAAMTAMKMKDRKGLRPRPVAQIHARTLT